MTVQGIKSSMFWFLCLILIISLIIMIVIPRIIRNSVQPLIFTVDQVPNHEVAIVFGAGLWRDGRPTAVLRDRVQTAVDLYKSGKVIKLLMSGDNRFINYNEPKAMYETALALGVPKEDIVLDYAGRRTYDTCYRAKYIFGIDEAILITQSFHLPRAIYTCQKLGISPNGVPADLRVYRRFASWYWNIRESFAILNALIELHVTHPVPVLGQPEPIFPKELE